MKMMLYLIIVLLAFFLMGFFTSPSEDLYCGFISCRTQAFSNSLFGRTRRSAVSLRAKAYSEPTERMAGVLAPQGSSLVNSTLASVNTSTQHAHSPSPASNTPPTEDPRCATPYPALPCLNSLLRPSSSTRKAAVGVRLSQSTSALTVCRPIRFLRCYGRSISGVNAMEQGQFGVKS
jgi:hypothetical protein